MLLLTPIKRLMREQRGQTMTEFALVLPVLVSLLFGIIQFGVLFNNYVTLTDAVRAGARTAAVSRLSTDPVGDTINKIESAASDLDQTKLTPVVPPASAFVRGNDIAVKATYPWEIRLPLIGITLASGDLTSTTTERVE
jgi:Flp pilus assembly protein TadG